MFIRTRAVNGDRSDSNVVGIATMEVNVQIGVACQASGRLDRTVDALRLSGYNIMLTRKREQVVSSLVSV